MATGRVSLLKFKRRIQFRQVAEAVTPHLLSGSSFSIPRISVRAVHCQKCRSGQTAFEAGSWLGLFRANGDRLAGYADL